jgi:hypothetical protein
MLRIRKVTTKSGSTAIQGVQYIGHKEKSISHIGSAGNDVERDLLIGKAKDGLPEAHFEQIYSPRRNHTVGCYAHRRVGNHPSVCVAPDGVMMMKETVYDVPYGVMMTVE